MVLAGSVLSFAGIGIVVFRVPFLGVTPLTPDLSALITVLWVVGMANAINLIDGLDGLAAGIVGIAAVTFFFYALRLSDEHIILTDNPGALVARSLPDFAWASCRTMPVASAVTRAHLHG
jgi:UDP-GlcNAc:undecaprenyl-phosphate GlcNAc-1-phosphate transferase